MNRTQIFGTHEENTLVQFKDVANGAERAALMADGHLGYVMPIGGVAAYQGKVSVTGVGFDIACGNAAIRTDLVAEKIAPHAEDIADEIAARISFGVGGSNSDDEAPVDDPLFSDPAWEALPRGADTHGLKNKARAQLGTIGSGNHYVDIFADDDGVVWVGVHFRSRGFGHATPSALIASTASIVARPITAITSSIASSVRSTIGSRNWLSRFKNSASPRLSPCSATS